MSPHESRVVAVLALVALLAISGAAVAQELPEDGAADGVEVPTLPDLPELDLSGVSETGVKAADGAGQAAGSLGAFLAAAGAAIAAATAAAGAAVADGAAWTGSAVAGAAVALWQHNAATLALTLHGYAVLGSAVSAAAVAVSASLSAAVAALADGAAALAAVVAAGGAAIAAGLAAAGAAIAAGLAAAGAVLAATIAGAWTALVAAILALFDHPALAHPAARVAAAAGLASVPVAGAAALYAASSKGWLDGLWEALGRFGRFAPLGALPLYSRIDKDSVLDNPVRERIFEFIQDHPGAHVSKISDDLELGWGTTVHHLKHLERLDMVSVRRARNHTCYFENGGTFSPREQRALAALKNSKARRIADLIRRRPGMSQKELARELDLSQSLISWHVAKLEKAGLIGRERHGKSYELLPGDGLVAALGAAE